MASLSRKRIGIAAGVVGILAVVAIAAYALSGNAKQPAAAANKNYAVYKDDMVMGSADAPVTIIEYAAPSCPHCAHFVLKDLPRLKKDYIDTGKVRFILRVYPLMPADAAIEIVARCLPKEKYYPYILYLYHHQPEWDPEYGITEVRQPLIKLSKEIGVSEETFEGCLKNHNISDSINRRAQDGQMRYNITGVPTFVVDGTVVEHADTAWDKMKARIDGLLAKS